MTVYVVERWRYEDPQAPLAVTRTVEGALRIIQAAGYMPTKLVNAAPWAFEHDMYDGVFASITPFELED